MNIISSGDGACERIHMYMDSYIADELPLETSHEMLRHLENCPSCSAEVEARSRLKTRLKAAVDAQSVPAGLQVRIRERVRRRDARLLLDAPWTRWALAAAVVLSVGIWVTRPRTDMPALEDRQGQDVFIQKVSQTVSAVLRAGLGDHIHCAVFRKYPKNPPALEQLVESIGPAYKSLVPLVKANVPVEYRIIMSHQCSFGSRRFIHVTLSNRSNLLSLVIARKEPGESLGALATGTRASGVPIYQAAADRYQIAAFETEQYLAFVVSNLNAASNLRIAGNLAPTVRDFLVRL